VRRKCKVYHINVKKKVAYAIMALPLYDKDQNSNKLKCIPWQFQRLVNKCQEKLHHFIVSPLNGLEWLSTHQCTIPKISFWDFLAGMTPNPTPGQGSRFIGFFFHTPWPLTVSFVFVFSPLPYLPPTSCFYLGFLFPLPFPAHNSFFFVFGTSSFFGFPFSFFVFCFYFLFCVSILKFLWSLCSSFDFVFFFFPLFVCVCILSYVCGAVEKEDMINKKGRRERKSNIRNNWKGWVSCSPDPAEQQW
jgi:hypothetical protein